MTCNQNFNWDPMNLPTIIKKIYTEKLHRTKDYADTYREMHNIHATGYYKPFIPIEHYDQLNLPANIISQLPVEPILPINAQLWPNIMRGCDNICLAEASTERTQSFTLPLVMHVLGQERIEPSFANTPVVLVMCPTTDHVVKVVNNIQNLCKNLTVLCGGRGVNNTTEELDPLHIIVSTSMWAQGMLKLRKLNLIRCSLVVVDDIDICMWLKQGPMIDDVLRQTRKDRQLVFMSHLWLADAKRLHGWHTFKWISVIVGDYIPDVTLAAKQHVEVIKNEIELLPSVVQMVQGIYKSTGRLAVKILIFAEETTAFCLSLKMKECGLACETLLSSYDSDQRLNALNNFRKGYKTILITADYPIIGLSPCCIENVILVDHDQAAYSYRLSYMRYTKTGGNAYVFFSFNKQRSKQLQEAIIWLVRANQNLSPELIQLKKKYNMPFNQQIFLDNLVRN